jgi:hypothetical protein
MRAESSKTCSVTKFEILNTKFETPLDDSSEMSMRIEDLLNTSVGCAPHNPASNGAGKFK